MGGITEAMLKRRAEHNDGVLYTLEELVLQEEGLDKIDKILGFLCPHLKYLYMPNNLVPRIENLHRLKELRYLNLALNNITRIEGLEQCESLQKLDLTLNFVDKKDLDSVSRLSCNVQLQELFLTGNPCQDFSGYRQFVIATLPFLKRLDGSEIKPSERIRAKQVLQMVIKQLESSKSGNDSKTQTEQNFSSTKNEKGQIIRDYTPAARLAEHAELEEMRGNKSDKEILEKTYKNTKRRQGFDPLPVDGRIYQKNEGGWNFKFMESDCKSKVLLDIPVGRYMDTSLIDIDIQPIWVRVLVKGKLLQLCLPEEVNPDASVAQRSTTTGNLLIIMPKASSNARVNVPTQLFYASKARQLSTERMQNSCANAARENTAILGERKLDDKEIIDLQGVASGNDQAKMKENMDFSGACGQEKTEMKVPSVQEETEFSDLPNLE